jgi:hypothetical protein
MSVTSPTLRFFPGAEELLDELLDELEAPLGLLELDDVVDELLPHAAKTKISATAPTTADTRYLIRAFTGLLSGRWKAQR